MLLALEKGYDGAFEYFAKDVGFRDGCEVVYRNRKALRYIRDPILRARLERAGPKQLFFRHMPDPLQLPGDVVKECILPHYFQE